MLARAGGNMAYAFALHLVTDRLESRLALPQAVAAAVRGGVDAVQVREKGQPAEVVLQAALAACSTASGALVLINDRVDVALAAGADGVHLPGRGLPPAVARRLLPSPGGWVVGVSVHSLQEATVAVVAGADYVTFGHVFPTGSKPGLPSRGLEALAEIVAAVEVPVLAIGGITAANVGQVLQTGCAGVAVIRALLQEADPQRAAAALREAMERTAARPRRALHATGRSGKEQAHG